MPRSSPPSYDRKIVAIDFDGTIAPWGPLMDVGAPDPRLRDALTALKSVGYRIVILTSRLSKEWWAVEAKARHLGSPEAFGKVQSDYVHAYLERYDLPYDVVTAEKVQARVYFDDRAWRTTPGELPTDLMELLENGRMDADV